MEWNTPINISVYLGGISYDLGMEEAYFYRPTFFCKISINAVILFKNEDNV